MATDPLIGKLFNEFKVVDGERAIIHTGQVRSRVREGVYLVRIMNALTLVAAGFVEFDKQRVVKLEDMGDWEFFETPEAWGQAYAEYDKAWHAKWNARRTQVSK